MEWPFKQNFSTCTFTWSYLFLLFVCHILPLSTFGSERIFSGEFHILNGTGALICFVVVFVFDSFLWFSSSFGLG